MALSLKLRTKLLAGFGLVLALLVVVIVIYQVAMSVSVSGFKGLLSEDLAMETDAREAEAYMLQCRRSEKDFLLRRDLKYRDQFKKDLAAMVALADSILPLPRRRALPTWRPWPAPSMSTRRPTAARSTTWPRPGSGAG